MALPYPPQLSTDPNVNASAMAWAAELVDALQNGIAGKRTASGTGTVTWPGASPYSNALNLAHGMRIAPAVAVFGTSSAGLGSFDVFMYGAPDRDTLFIQAVTTGTTGNPVLGATGTFYWLAIA